MVIRSDFVWLSHNIKPELCPIIIVQNATGQFMGTHVKKPLYVGEFVESFACVRSKKPIITSTPQEMVVLVTLDQVLKKTCHQLLKFQKPAHQLSCCETKLQNLKKKV